MDECILRVGGDDHHEFDHIYDEIDEDYFPCEIFQDDDADVLEAEKCHRTKKIYVRSICRYCGMSVER